MYCNYCGAPNPDDASFCSTCGKASAQSSAKVAAQEQPSPKLAPPSSLGAAPVAATEGESPVRMRFAILSAIKAGYFS